MLKAVFMIITAAICFGAPIGWFIAVRRGEKGYVGALIAGGLSFYLSQMVIRIPLIQLVLPGMAWYQDLSENLIGIGLFLGLTAALFETVGRYLTIKLLLKKRLSYRTGLAHGIGHGGIEAIMLVGINYAIYSVYVLLYTGGNPAPLGFMFPPEAQEMMQTLIIDSEALPFLAAGLERGMTLVVHVALSLLMMVGIVKGRVWKYFLIILAIHGSLDFLAVYLGGSGVNFWWIELVLLGYALASAFIIYRLEDTIPKDANPDEGETAVKEGY